MSAHPEGHPPSGVAGKQAQGAPASPPAGLPGFLRRPPAWTLAALLAIVYVILAPQSPDLAAASYRSHLFSSFGFTLWDNSWYGGHHLPAYSLLAPALGALLGPALLAALSMVAATALFELATSGRFPPRAARAGAFFFAFGAGIALLSSRVPFDLGLAIGLASVVLAQRGRWAAALAVAALTAVASPVAGAFLALGAVSWGVAIPAERPRCAALAACGLAPILVLSVAFPEGGTQPFVASAFWPAFLAVAAIGLVLPREQRVLRIGALLYAIALLGAYVVPSAVGGNVDRLGALAAGPLAVCGLLEATPRWRHIAALLLVAPLLYWQVNAPLTDYVSTVGNPGVEESYYAPLLAELRTLGVGYGARPVRIEVVPTVDHWEARYVAPAAMIARGWERQLDRYRNPLFYEDGPPTLHSYAAWLDEQAISYVALPDAPLDYSGKAEARLVTSPGSRGLLRELWRSSHWRLFAVIAPRPLAAPPSRLQSAGTDSFVLSAPSAGTFEVRLRFTPYWSLSSAHGCVEEAPGGWTAVRTGRPETVHVGIDFSLARVLHHGARCR